MQRKHGVQKACRACNTDGNADQIITMETLLSSAGSRECVLARSTLALRCSDSVADWGTSIMALAQASLAKLQAMHLAGTPQRQRRKVQQSVTFPSVAFALLFFSILPCLFSADLLVSSCGFTCYGPFHTSWPGHFDVALWHMWVVVVGGWWWCGCGWVVVVVWWWCGCGWVGGGGGVVVVWVWVTKHLLQAPPTQLGSWRSPLSALGQSEEALAANAQKSKWFAHQRWLACLPPPHCRLLGMEHGRSLHPFVVVPHWGQTTWQSYPM